MSQTAFTCITCHVAFVNADIQRNHYKSDWHRYNLKRKVVGLPPVTVEEFQHRAAAQQAIEEHSQNEKDIAGLACKVCRRTFSSFSTHKDHLLSKRHKNAEAKELEQLQKKLEEQSEAHFEKAVSDDGRIELEKKAIQKALAEARSSIKQPRVIRIGERKKVQKDPYNNPRMRWFKKQMKAIEDNCDDANVWEEMSDTEEEIVGDQDDFSANDSQTESTCTETSSLPGILSKVKLDSDADVESLASEGNYSQKLLGPKDCLFCNERFESLETNVTHMSRKHSFFIPELAYVVDLEGLLTYLGEKVGVGNICLKCNEKGRTFYSLQAVRGHMIAKGHCNMLTEGDAALEYADFYDFSSSYPDDLADDDDGEKREDDTISIFSMSSRLFQPDCNVEDMELVLPSGARVGHRSLIRYYKQNFPTVDRFKSQRKTVLNRLMAQYKAIGWNGMQGDAVAKLRQRDIRFVQKMKSRYNQKLGTKNNKTMMKHFRPQVLF